MIIIIVTDNSEIKTKFENKNLFSLIPEYRIGDSISFTKYYGVVNGIVSASITQYSESSSSFIHTYAVEVDVLHPTTCKYEKKCYSVDSKTIINAKTNKEKLCQKYNKRGGVND